MRIRFVSLALLASVSPLAACDDAVVGPTDDGSGGSTSTPAASGSTAPDAASSGGDAPATTTGSSSGNATAGGGGAGGGDCQDACELDDVTCLDDDVIRCVAGSDGCTTWSLGEPCPADAPYCAAGACSTECVDTCSPNEVRCTDGAAEHCEATDTPDGPCFRWAQPEACDSANACLVTGCEIAVGCTSDPVVCDDPPPSECIDADTLRVWDASGACDADGTCAYQENDVACPSCPSCDACAAVTCDDPPSVCFEASGTCDDGSCSYDYDDGATCDDGDACTDDDGCDTGVCAGTPITCDDPPTPTCVDDDTLRTFAASGTCDGGDCDYDFVDETCPSGCEDDACVSSWTPLATAVAPAGRNGHVAVWTGSQMIVWGGEDASFPPAHLASGGRYTPGTDSWAPTTLTGAPSPRTTSAAVWTGTEMIVWGGVGIGASGTGGRYRPGNDSWATVSATSAPTSTRHTAVWTGDVMVVWGGDGSSGRYDPDTNTWASVQSGGEPTPRSNHTAVWTGSEMIVWGGRSLDTPTEWFDSGGRYDPTSNSWAPISTVGAPTPREDHTAIWTGTEMIVWGGDQAPFDDGGRYDPATNTWSPLETSGAPDGRVRHTAVWTGSSMLIWGGLVSPAGIYSPTATGGRFAGDADTWSATSMVGVPTARYGHTAVWTGTALLVWGGSGAGTQLATGGRYEP